MWRRWRYSPKFTVILHKTILLMTNFVFQVPSLESSRVNRERLDSVSTTSEPEMGYFNMYSKELLIQGVKNCISEGYHGDIDGKPANLRPFRILISLLDKPEIGSVILEDVLIEIFRCMYRECMSLTGDSPDLSGSSTSLNNTLGSNSRGNKKRDAKVKRDEKSISSEIVKTANLLFGVFEPYFIWDFLARVFEKVCMHTGRDLSDLPPSHDMGGLNVEELCHLVDFLLDKLTLVSPTI